MEKDKYLRAAGRQRPEHREGKRMNESPSSRPPSWSLLDLPGSLQEQLTVFLLVNDVAILGWWVTLSICEFSFAFLWTHVFHNSTIIWGSYKTGNMGELERPEARLWAVRSYHTNLSMWYFYKTHGLNIVGQSVLPARVRPWVCYPDTCIRTHTNASQSWN